MTHIVWYFIVSRNVTNLSASVIKKISFPYAYKVKCRGECSLFLAGSPPPIQTSNLFVKNCIEKLLETGDMEAIKKSMNNNHGYFICLVQFLQSCSNFLTAGFSNSAVTFCQQAIHLLWWTGTTWYPFG